MAGGVSKILFFYFIDLLAKEWLGRFILNVCGSVFVLGGRHFLVGY